MRPGGAGNEGGEFAVFLPEFLPPTGDDFTVSAEGFVGGGFAILLIKVEDLHALFGDIALIELAQAMEHVIRPPKALNFIKDAPYLHGKTLFPNVAYVS